MKKESLSRIANDMLVFNEVNLKMIKLSEKHLDIDDELLNLSCEAISYACEVLENSSEFSDWIEFLYDNDGTIEHELEIFAKAIQVLLK